MSERVNSIVRILRESWAEDPATYIANLAYATHRTGYYSLGRKRRYMPGDHREFLHYLAEALTPEEKGVFILYSMPPEEIPEKAEVARLSNLRSPEDVDANLRSIVKKLCDYADYGTGPWEIPEFLRRARARTQ